MFIKPYLKHNRTTGERYVVYKLCEGYRQNGKVGHRIVISFGRLNELETDDQRKLLGKRVEELLVNGGNTLSISAAEQQVEQLARVYYEQICRSKRYDVKTDKPEWEMVDISTLKNKDAREIGAEWLCKQALDQLGITDFLGRSGWKEDMIGLALTHIISRAVYPASELKTVSFIRENSAISEVTKVDRFKITKDRLYTISHKLYQMKDSLEQHLSRRTNELFDLEDKIILFDLTNTYFEGRLTKSKIAKFGRSKEKRKDARLVVLALVINCEGFLKHSNIYQGNVADCSTLEDIINSLTAQTSYTQRKPIVVIDAGIATEDNLKLLKAKGHNYMAVSRTSVKEYYADINATPVQITDNRKQPIELLKVEVAGESDQYLWVKSHAKKMKENSMNGLLSQRFELGLENIRNGIMRRAGTKKLTKVHERIGRLKQKYPSVHDWYTISICDDGNGTATSISWCHKSGEYKDGLAGIYFLRTSMKNLDERTFWSIYNVIREIEYTFRVLKTDLNLRPIYHKTDEATMAHLHLSILAYWVVATIRYQLKIKSVHSDWREIVRIMNTQKCITTSMVNRNNETISIRQCTEPIKAARTIYDALQYKYAPFARKKSVVPPSEN
jgi:transposase